MKALKVRVWLQVEQHKSRLHTYIPSVIIWPAKVGHGQLPSYRFALLLTLEGCSQQPKFG